MIQNHDCFAESFFIAPYSSTAEVNFGENVGAYSIIGPLASGKFIGVASNKASVFGHPVSMTSKCWCFCFRILNLLVVLGPCVQ